MLSKLVCKSKKLKPDEKMDTQSNCFFKGIKTGYILGLRKQQQQTRQILTPATPLSNVSTRTLTPLSNATPRSTRTLPPFSNGTPIPTPTPTPLKRRTNRRRIIIGSPNIPSPKNLTNLINSRNKKLQIIDYLTTLDILNPVYKKTTREKKRMGTLGLKRYLISTGEYY